MNTVAIPSLQNFIAHLDCWYETFPVRKFQRISEYPDTLP
jgi:hypothetical protein